MRSRLRSASSSVSAIATKRSTMQFAPVSSWPCSRPTAVMWSSASRWSAVVPKLRMMLQPLRAAISVVARLAPPSQTGSGSWIGGVAIVVGLGTCQNSPSKVNSRSVSAVRRSSSPSIHRRMNTSSGIDSSERQPDLARDAPPEAELEAAVAEGVERARLLGDADRVVERQDGDRGAEADAAGPRRGGRQEEVRRGAGERAGVVLGDRDAVEAELLGLHREVHEVEDLALLPARVVVVGGGVVGVETDAVGVDHLDPLWVIAELGHDTTLPACGPRLSTRVKFHRRMSN